MPARLIHIRMHIFLLLALLLGSCNLPAGTPVTPTSPVPTVAASLPSDTPAPTDALPSSTPPLPATAAATTAPTLAPSATSLPAATLPPLQPGQPLTLTQLHMVSAQIGWGVGAPGGASDYVLKTEDGGSTWIAAGPPVGIPADPALARQALGYFLDAQNAWVIYSVPGPQSQTEPPVVWRTADGGENWQAGAPLDVSDLNEFFGPLFIGFSSSTDGWLVAGVGVGMNHQYFVLYRTSDGGETWARLLDPYTGGGEQSCEKTGLTFLDAGLGWITRDCHGVAPYVTVDITRDGGASWEQRELPAPTALQNGFDYPNICWSHSPHLFSAQNGLLGVSCQQYLETPTPQGDSFAPGPQYLYRTTDGGDTWEIEAYSGGVLQFTDFETGWALGRRVQRTTDGGAGWELRSEVTWEAQFSILGDELLWALARSADERALVFSSDGGRRWILLQPLSGP